ncbi:MAG: nuclease-related domain-containing protein [Eubacteriales bacterium]|nr:nuclease-related domain-containing protein [Eubacteriales bacterium]
MTVKKSDELIDLMAGKGICNREHYTHNEYMEMLLLLQKEAVNIGNDVFNMNAVRLNELIAGITQRSREKGCENLPVVTKAIRGLRNVDKEIAISMAGSKSEDFVAHSVSFANRPEMVCLRNVYLSDGDVETELDEVVLTNNGIIILEVKGCKEDITINSDGRILVENSTCYHDVSMGEKMEIKRRLLKNALEEKLPSLPVYVDSYIVFSHPKDKNVRINDQYHMEKWCRRGKIQYVIQDYTSDTSYDPEVMSRLTVALEEIAQCQKGFDSRVDFEDVRNDFAHAIEVLTETQQDKIEEREADDYRKTSRVIPRKKKWMELVPAVSAAAFTIVIGATIGAVSFSRS